MRLFSLLYIAASHTVHVHYFSCILLVVIFFILFYFIFNMLSFIFFSINFENVGECCKDQ